MVPLPRIGPGREFEPLPVGASERVFVLTGAGISAESGVRPFRDAGGLWEEHRIEDVATPEGFARDPRMVWRFYSERRRHAASVRPNPAHLALANLEAQLGDRLFLCTQNVDALHEKAGSRGVLHMHGELLKSRCDSCDRPPFPDETVYQDLPRCPCGGRPSRGGIRLAPAPHAQHPRPIRPLHLRRPRAPRQFLRLRRMPPGQGRRPAPLPLPPDLTPDTKGPEALPKSYELYNSSRAVRVPAADLYNLHNLGGWLGTLIGRCGRGGR